MLTIHRGLLPSLALTLAVGLLPLDAAAVTRDRDVIQSATGVCQAALPAYEGLIRKRPLAVQNEGSAGAFVTCSMAGTALGIDGTRSISSLYLYLDNNSANFVTVTCTLVDGLSGTTNVYLPKAIVLPANSKFSYLRWNVTDNDGNRYLYSTNTSCNLPAGTGISATWVTYREDVGA